MALLSHYIDSRTSAGLTTDDSLTFAHGLPAEPDFCDIQYITNIVTAAEKFQLACLTDATNVTVINNGNTTSPDYRVMSIVFHSIMR